MSDGSGEGHQLTAKENKQHAFQWHQILVVQRLLLALDQLLGFHAHCGGLVWVCAARRVVVLLIGTSIQSIRGDSWDCRQECDATSSIRHGRWQRTNDDVLCYLVGGDRDPFSTFSICMMMMCVSSWQSRWVDADGCIVNGDLGQTDVSLTKQRSICMMGAVLCRWFVSNGW